MDAVATTAPAAPVSGASPAGGGSSGGNGAGGGTTTSNNTRRQSADSAGSGGGDSHPASQSGGGQQDQQHQQHHPTDHHHHLHHHHEPPHHHGHHAHDGPHGSPDDLMHDDSMHHHSSSSQHQSYSSQQMQQMQQMQQQQHQQQQQQQQQHHHHMEPVNFNSGSQGPGGRESRRVTIGGLHASQMGAVGGRRDSLASVGFLDDLYRRGSMNFADFSMESIFGGGGGGGTGRRESLDSTDAAFFGMPRRSLGRQYSLSSFGGANMPGPPDFGPTASSGNASFGGFGGGAGIGMGMGMGMNAPGGAGLGSASQHSALGGVGASSTSVSALAARQQQLQQQQFELEHQQRELELKRQQLITAMRKSNVAASSGTPPLMSHGSGLGFVGAGVIPHASNSYVSGAGGGGGGGGYGGSLGLGGSGSFHSHGSGGLGGSARSTVPSHRSNAGSSSGAGGGGLQWMICQVCNSEAFTSHEKLMAHEAICQKRAIQNEYGGGGLDGSMRSAMSGHHHHHLSSHHDMSNRNYSLGMDSSSHSAYDTASTVGLGAQMHMSSGPFARLEQPMPLAMPSDKDWLTPLHCFVRKSCVEIFTASEQDVTTPSKGKRKPIQVGQVGIRCPHCHATDSAQNTKARERGSVYYPTTISSIYNATMNLLQRHLHGCPHVPDDIMRRYETLKADDARSGTSKRYWIDSALSLGLVDTPQGIRYSELSHPPLPASNRPQQEGSACVRRNSNEFFGSDSNAMSEMKEAAAAAAAANPDREDGEGTGEGGGDNTEPDQAGSTAADVSEHAENGRDTDGAAAGATNPNICKAEHDMADSAPLVTPQDKPYSTTFSYHLLSQMQPCVFTEADRLGKRKGLPLGFPGLACRHCFGGYGSGRFFPSSIKTLSDTSKTLNVLYNHMMRCRKCPADVRETLENLRSSHDEERAKMKFGSQKAFFARIWERLHGKGKPPSLKRAMAQSGASAHANALYSDGGVRGGGDGSHHGPSGGGGGGMAKPPPSAQGSFPGIDHMDPRRHPHGGGGGGDSGHYGRHGGGGGGGGYDVRGGGMQSLHGGGSLDLYGSQHSTGYYPMQQQQQQQLFGGGSSHMSSSHHNTSHHSQHHHMGLDAHMLPGGGGGSGMDPMGGGSGGPPTKRTKMV